MRARIRRLLTLLPIMILCLAAKGQDTVTSSTEAIKHPYLEPADFYKKDIIPLSLEMAIFKTLENNLNIHISDYDRQIAEAEIEVQKGIFDLMLSSSLSVSDNDSQSASYDDNDKPGTSYSRVYSGSATLSQLLPFGGNVGLYYNTMRTNSDAAYPSINPSFKQGAGIFIQQPLLRNFGSYFTLSGIRIAQNNERISQEAFLLQVHSQVTAVIKAYWDLVFAIENYEVKRLTLQQAEDFLRITTISYRTGVVPETDVLQAKAQVSTMEELVIIAESVIKAAEDALKNLMSLPRASRDWNSFFIPTDQPVVTRLEIDTEAMIDTALEKRPEYIQARIGLENSEINRRVAKNQRMPELNLYASAGRTGLGESHADAWDELHTYDYHTYEAGLEFSFPLQNRSARNRYRQAVLGYEKTEIMIANLENSIMLEIRNAVRAIETQHKRVEATAVSVAAEKAKLESETQRYRVGMSTSYNVLSFQKDYAEALSHHIESKVLFNRAQAELYKASGTVLEMYRIRTDDILKAAPVEASSE